MAMFIKAMCFNTGIPESFDLQVYHFETTNGPSIEIDSSNYFTKHEGTWYIMLNDEDAKSFQYAGVRIKELTIEV
jgi:hypothetical protein